MTTSSHSVAAGPSTWNDEVGDALLVLGAEALGRRREPGRCLAERLADDEDPADPVAGLEGGDLLTHEEVGGVSVVQGDGVQGVVGDEPVDAAALVLELAHRLLEGVALDADEVARVAPERR